MGILVINGAHLPGKAFKFKCESHAYISIKDKNLTLILPKHTGHLVVEKQQSNPKYISSKVLEVTKAHLQSQNVQLSLSCYLLITSQNVFLYYR